mgnify:CR=1 FL=1
MLRNHQNLGPDRQDFDPCSGRGVYEYTYRAHSNLRVLLNREDSPLTPEQRAKLEEADRLVGEVNLAVWKREYVMGKQ